MSRGKTQACCRERWKTKKLVPVQAKPTSYKHQWRKHHGLYRNTWRHKKWRHRNAAQLSPWIALVTGYCKLGRKAWPITIRKERCAFNAMPWAVPVRLPSLLLAAAASVVALAPADGKRVLHNHFTLMLSYLHHHYSRHLSLLHSSLQAKTSSVPQLLPAVD